MIFYVIDIEAELTQAYQMVKKLPEHPGKRKACRQVKHHDPTFAPTLHREEGRSNLSAAIKLRA